MSAVTKPGINRPKCKHWNALQDFWLPASLNTFKVIEWKCQVLKNIWQGNSAMFVDAQVHGIRLFPHSPYLLNITANIKHNLQSAAYLHQVRFQIRMVALVQTQVLIAIPVPNMENRLIFSTIRLGRFLMVHSGIGLLVWEAIVTLASHLSNTSQRWSVYVSTACASHTF